VKVRPLRVLGVLAFYALPLVLSQLPPVRAFIFFVIERMREGGAGGVAVYAAVFALGAVLVAPTALFTGMAGYVYGPGRGLLIASPASVLAASTAFLAGRFALAGRIRPLLAREPRWAAVERAVDADAFRIGFLLRVTPLAPQNFLSYALSLTPMRLRTFMAATWLGLLPIVAFQVYVGSLVHDVADLLDGKRPPLGVWSWVATVASLLLTGAALFVITRLGRRALARQGV
jgi:uncharacterized membrane protein YdjX (TVP38/TMEM64 family)